MQVASCSLRSVGVPIQALQRFVARTAAAIHAADPHAQVTVGSHSLPYISDAQWLKGSIDAFEMRPWNLFSDAALKAAFLANAPGHELDKYVAAGGDESAASSADAIGGRGGLLPGFIEGLSYLDFYAPHGYPYWGDRCAYIAPDPLPAACCCCS